MRIVFSFMVTVRLFFIFSRSFMYVFSGRSFLYNKVRRFVSVIFIITLGMSLGISCFIFFCFIGGKKIEY